MMAYITPALVLASLLAALSCNEARVSLSADDQTANALGEGAQITAEEPADPPPPVVVEEIPGPKKWPKCWLSSRLSLMNALRISGFGAGDKTDPLYSAEQGRQEFRGHSKNPTTHGDCVLNWFGQDHSKEPWVLQLQTGHPNMHAALTCTADATPQCNCISVIPPPPYRTGNGGGIDIKIGLCVRDSAAGGHELYNYNDPDSSQTIPAAGRCTAVSADTSAIGKARLHDNSFLQQNQDSQHTGASGSTCRTDIEPFAPLDEERDWYADKIRDWAITTCTDPITNCRCYTIHNKSGHEEGKRDAGFEYGTCLLCTNGTCKQAALP